MKPLWRNTWQYLLIFNILLLNACTLSLTGLRETDTPPNLIDPPAHTDGSCIQPITKLAYPIGIPKPLNEEPIEIAPLGGWQDEASLPETLDGRLPQIVTRMKDVWLLSHGVNKVFRYQTDTHQWTNYITIGDASAVPRELFLTSDGTLWGIGVVSLGEDTTPSLPLLSRYNEDTDQFEFVQDIDGLLATSWIATALPPVSEDQTGLMWFFASKFGDEGSGDEGVRLYSFDPSTRKAKKHLSLPSGLIYTTPVIAPDGRIWYYHGGPERHLFTYSPTTRESQAFYGIPSFERVGHLISLFFDQDGRLWADNKGWLDFADPDNPIWYEIIPSVAFLTDQGAFFYIDDVEGPRSRYGFTPPINISQSSNGWMWFTTFYGTIRLDLEKEEWCLFTTGGSPVVEDNEGNVWISVFDKLYKYQLEP